MTKRTTRVDNPAAMHRACNGLLKLDKFPCWLSWTDERNKTAEQLGYFFGVVIPAIQHHLETTGDGRRWDKADLAEWFAEEYLPNRVVEIDGKPKVVQTRISNLNVKPMSEFIDAVIRHMVNQGCVIPEAE